MNEGLKSSTLKSYVSAIKHFVNLDEEYVWDDNKILLSTLTRTCRSKNDRVITRLPVQKGLLELIIFKTGRRYDAQPYLKILYQTIFAIGYFGMFRISELVGIHAIKAKDIHSATNKNKVL